MAYDEGLAERVRDVLRADDVVATEKKMFGGLCFLMDGHMVVGIIGDDLLARPGVDGHEAALAQPHARVFDFTGKPSRGMVYVAPAGTAEDDDLRRWVLLGVAVAAALPPKR